MKTALSLLVIVGLIIAGWLVLKSLSAPGEDSALSMHPSNFKKPLVEQVESFPHVLPATINFLDHTVAYQEGYVNSAGVRIFYRAFGSGQPLLIINGGPGMSSEGFIPLAKTLSKNYRTIIFDQRGTGKSIMIHPDSKNITMDLMTADMEALRNHFKFEGWTLMGHSFGGMLAAYYTGKHPQMVQGLILSSSGGLDMQLFSYIDIRGRLTQTEKESLRYWNQQISNGDTTHHAAYQRGLALAPAYLYSDEHIPVIAERLTQGNAQINGLVFQDMRRIDFDCKPALKNFSRPTLIIQGAEDIIDRATAQRTKEILPQADMVILERCGHYGWLDQQDQYYYELQTFLSSIG
ncbi:MAG: alpha/beta hydrolase [Cyclobacteriaceae bacterium]|nr:alpha/beta hydrolase [Cyclobacteriaceae bacterium]